MANNRAIRWELACLLLPGALNGGRVSESVGIKRTAFLSASASERKRPGYTRTTCSAPYSRHRGSASRLCPGE